MGLKAYLEDDPQCGDLARGAILAAAPLLADPDPRPVLATLDAWAFELASRMPLPWNLHHAIDAINHHLFQTVGLQGDGETYDSPANAALPLVLERRRGLPITLSILWMELFRRMGLPAIGIPLPGHFITGLQLDLGPLYFDPFHGGRPVGEAEAARLVHQAMGGRVSFTPDMLHPASHREILIRLVRNLHVRFLRSEAWDDALWATSHLVLLSPGDPLTYRDRAAIHLQRNHLAEALADLEQAASLSPRDPELEALIRQLHAGRTDHGSAPLS